MVAQPLHLYLFPSGVNTIGGLQSCILLCNSSRLCICTLYLSTASVELCNSFLSITLILDMKSYVLHFIRVALYGHVSRPSVRSLSFVTKLKKYFRHLMYAWLCTPGV